jgi:hypothetical protein
MTIDKAVFVLCLCAGCFLAGLIVGEEQSAVKLQPCPQAGKAELIRATVSGQVCTYAEIVRGGKKIRWEIKPL